MQDVIAFYKRYSLQKMRILVSGTHGLVGKALFLFLEQAGHTLFSLERGALTASRSSSSSLYWNPSTGEVDLPSLENFDAVIHLAGKSISAGLWNKKRKEEIFLSRCRDSWLLCKALSRLKNPPKIFLSASAIGYYGDRGETFLEEESAPGKGFLADLCQHWERASAPLIPTASRILHARFGLILSPLGGVFPKWVKPISYDLGVSMGKGENSMSWVALEDVLGAIYHLLATSSIEGAVNITAPHPLRQKEILADIAKVLGGKAPFYLPEKIVSLLLGEMGRELLLTSQYVLPKKLLDSGYLFTFPKLEHFLRKLT